MDILLMIVTGIVCGLVATFITRREGIGWWMGDQIVALFGAGFGTYMVYTRHQYKPLEAYLYWVVLFAAGGALVMLMFSHWLLGGEEEEEEPVFVDDEEEHTMLEHEPPYEYPIGKAA